jgi:hypothetical protein
VTAGVGVILWDGNLYVSHTCKDVLRYDSYCERGLCVADNLATRAESGVDCRWLEKVKLPTVEGSFKVAILVSEFKLNPSDFLSRVWVLEVAQAAFKLFFVLRR